MVTKNFKTYLDKRLDKKEIAEIERQAENEVRALRDLQDDISKVIAEYMVKNDIGFNEVVRRLDISPTQLTKIQKGEANLTLASIAHISALIGKAPHINFK